MIIHDSLTLFGKLQAFCNYSLKRHLVNEISKTKAYSSQISMGSLEIMCRLYLKPLSMDKKLQKLVKLCESEKKALSTHRKICSRQRILAGYPNCFMAYICFAIRRQRFRLFSRSRSLFGPRKP